MTVPDAVPPAVSPGLVSVIIPTYNRERLVLRAVESCLGQSYPHVEVIVVDDGSTDDTLPMLRREIERHGAERLRVVQGEHRGAWAARNQGFAVARGEFIQFLDSDDYLAESKLEDQVAALRSSGCAMALCDYEHVFETEGGVRHEPAQLDREAPYETVTMFTPLILRSAIPDDVRFREMPRQQYDDQEFLLRIYLRTMDWVFVS
ncbi:MAG: glycosyltransferase family 2 protein, partial [Planctomycetota bacterium]